MSDTKMLQAIINGQSSIKSELLTKIESVAKKVDEVKDELKLTEKRLTKRIDRLGFDLAELSDDAPTVDEFDKLEKRVSKLELVIKN